MPSTLRRKACGLLGLALLAAGCDSSNKSSAAQSIVGTVVDEQAQALGGTTLSVGTSELRTTSAPDGSFSLTLPASMGSTVPLMAEDANHARTLRVVNAAGSSNPITLVMHPFDTVSTVALPAPGAPPVTVNVQNPNGVASLAIAAGSLVLPSGAVATGTVQVRMAYWSGNDDHMAAPSVLWGIDADGTFNKLDSFGMVDFSIVQNGNRLQVAPGQTLTLSLPLSADQNALFSGANAALPNVYAVDPGVGVWTYAGGVSLSPSGAQKLAADSQGRHLQQGDNVRAVLEKGYWKIYVTSDHAWNIDLGIRLSAGGCVSGRTVDACTKLPVANTAFTHYFLSIEEVAGFEGQSNSSGTFCTATPFSTWSGAASQNTASVKYFISKKDDASHTAYCNPAAKYPQCFVPHPVNVPGQSSSEPGQINYISDCRLGNSDRQADQGIATARYQDTCVPHAAALSISPCTFCSAASAPGRCTANNASYSVAQAAGNGSCTQLGDVPVPTPTCSCDNTGNCHLLCKVNHTVGSACLVNPKDPQNADKFIACCNTDNTFKPGELQCGDDVCIATSAL